MAEDLAKLVVRLEAETGRYQRELDKANKRLDNFAMRQRQGVRKVKDGFLGLAASITSVVAAGAGLRKLVSTAREFDVINASLVTATGSAEGAEAAFKRIEEFAATTPFQLTEVADAFVKLTNLGLDPSERALVSYGNTASAMGKSLNQFIEAVADAATGEFERLKEFGIKSKSQGDQVIFTFRGVETTVEKSATAIEGYLRRLGEVEFAGAMEARAQSLDGALSNLTDAFDSLFRKALSEPGAQQLNDAIRELSELLQNPDTIKAAQDLTGVLVTGFTKALEAGKNFTLFLDSLDGESQNLGVIQKQIEDIEAILNGGFFAQTERLRFFGPDGIVSFESTAELEAKLDTLIKKRDQLLAINKLQPIDVIGRRIEPEVLGGATAGPSPRVTQALREEADLEEIRKRDLQRVIESLQTEEERLLESYNRRREIILNATELTGEERKELELRLIDDTLQEVEVKAVRVQKDIQAKAETQAEAFDRIFGAGALTQLFSDLDNIEERFKSLLANIAAQAIAAGIANIFSGGTFGQGVGGFFGGLFGARAAGGPVTPGRPYVVGERGPELMVPNVSGNIVPNHQMVASGGNVSVVAALGDAEIEKWLGSKTGERVVLAHIRRNQATVRALARA